MKTAEIHDILFAKFNEDVKIPSKINENGCYDLYVSPDITKDIHINVGEIVIINSGLASVFSEKYFVCLKERGSTGTRCMAIRAGIIDSGYRGQWMIPINNTGNKDIIITSEVSEVKENDLTIFYPKNKAIAQFAVVEVPVMNIKEISIDELKDYPSVRLNGKLGSSGK